VHDTESNSIVALPLEKLWDPKNRAAVLTISVGMIVVIALVDWWTLPYVALGFLYLFPIMLAAGFLSRPTLVVLGIFCAVLSQTFSSLDSAWRVSRLIFEALALSGCGLFVSELLRNRRLTLETQQRLRALVETSPAAILTVGQDGTIELANEAAAELLAPANANLLGQPVAAFLPELQKALHSGVESEFRTSMQCEAHRGNGESFVAEVWFSTFKEGGTPKLAAIIGDVTEEQRTGPPSGANAANGKKRPSLNSRQVAVLRLVLEGLSSQEIASRLEMTPSAVKNTLQQLFSKSGVKNRSQLVRVALERYRDLL
jgi:PAS domain S-box-containing protein